MTDIALQLQDALDSVSGFSYTPKPLKASVVPGRWVRPKSAPSTAHFPVVRPGSPLLCEHCLSWNAIEYWCSPSVFALVCPVCRDIPTRIREINVC